MLSLKNKGFTLIELLIAIVIIGLLATLVMVNIGGATSRGRDARRASDLKQIATALALYFEDHNAYPPAAADCLSTATCWTGLLTAADGTKKYIPLVPRDPKNIAPQVYIYCNISSGTRFVVAANFENDIIAAQQLKVHPNCSATGATDVKAFWVGN